MSDMITSLTLIFITASLVLFFFDRKNQPSIPAYIIAGILIGFMVNQQNILTLSQIGIAFLVFVFGASLEIRKIHNLLRSNIKITIIQTAAIGAFVYLVAWIIGFNTLNSAYLSIAAALSSSIVGTELLDGKDSKLVHKRLCSSINLVQDVLAVFFFLFLTTPSGGASIITMNIVLGITLVLIGIVVKNLLPLLIESVERSREMYILISISTLLVFVAIAQFFGLSIVIGAFAAGLALSKNPYNQEVIQTVGSLKDFFAAIFFVSLGALLTVPGIEVVMLSLLMISIVSLVKPVFSIYSIQQNGYNKRTAYMTSLNLDQISEFSLMMAIEAFAVQNISNTVFQTIILTATVTMIISSYTSRYSEEIYSFMDRHRMFSIVEKDFEDKELPENLENHYIIGGYDVQGKELVRALEEMGEQVVAIDNNPEKIEEARADGVNFIYGDMMVDSIWEEANYRDAKMIISTVPVALISEKIIELNTDSDMIVRAHNFADVNRFIDRCLYVIYPHHLSSKRLIEHLKGSLESGEYRKRLRKISRREID